MRLINVHSMRLETFYGADQDIPRYAILSHTWGTDELTLPEFAHHLHAHLHKDGYAKIKACCRLAAQARLDYAWVDTVCIDKSSSAELTEAINSMFRWYKNAAVCHVWLHDLAPDADLTEWNSCRWFTRGWTLQELLAPARVEFHDRDWTLRGIKRDLQRELSHVTRISEAVLGDPDRMFGLTIAQRMSWAASRTTTRPEDLAYCLLGIFDVHMPLLYGEGERAFLRLQEEIARETNDLSLFAWRLPEHEPQAELQGKEKQPFFGILATSPTQFIGSGGLVAMRDYNLTPEYTITNKGVRLDANLTELDDGRLLLLLDVLSRATRTEIGIWIRAHGGGLYSRVEASSFSAVPRGVRATVATQKRIYLLKRISPAYASTLLSGHRGAILLRDNFCRCSGRPDMTPEFLFEAIRMHPQDDWVAERRMMYTHGASEFFVFVWIRPRQSPTTATEVTMFGEGVAVLAVGKLEYEDTPFALLMGTGMADRVLPPSGRLDKRLLSTSRGGRGTVTLPLQRKNRGLKLSVSLEKTTIDDEVVHCIDLAYQMVTGNF